MLTHRVTPLTTTYDVSSPTHGHPHTCGHTHTDTDKHTDISQDEEEGELGKDGRDKVDEKGKREEGREGGEGGEGMVEENTRSPTSSMRLLRSLSTVCGGNRRIKSRAQSSW